MAARKTLKETVEDLNYQETLEEKMLHQNATKRFSKKFDHLVDFMEMLAKKASECNADHACTELGFLTKEDEVKDGEWVPSITLTVRRDDNLKD